MSLYYSLFLRGDTYFAESMRQEENWIRIYVIGKKTETKCILFDGKMHIDVIKLWINKKSLKSKIPFQGERYAWNPISELPEDFIEAKRQFDDERRM